MKTIFIKNIVLCAMCFYQVCFAAAQMSQEGVQIRPNLSRQQGIALSLCQFKMQAREVIEASHLDREKGATIIFWFAGILGLRDKAETFFRNNIMNPLGANNTLWGYDLSAWGVLLNLKKYRETQYEIQDYEKLKLMIECSERDYNNFNCVLSYKFFVWLKEVLQRYPEFIKQILERDFIYEKSRGHADQEAGMTLDRLQAVVPDVQWGTLLQGTRLKGYPISSAYSSLQYLEGLFLIQEAAKKTNRIVFFLQNDEYIYYFDPARQKTIDDFVSDIRRCPHVGSK
jgi:hypothetical protein